MLPLPVFLDFFLQVLAQLLRNARVFVDLQRTGFKWEESEEASEIWCEDWQVMVGGVAVEESKRKREREREGEKEKEKARWREIVIKERRGEWYSI